MTGSSGFEFGSTSTQDPDKTSSGVGSLSSKPVADSFAPTAKEVNKSPSNALSSSGKLNPTAGSTVAAAVANPSSQQDSFSKSSSSATAPTANNSSGVPILNHAAVAPGGGSGGGGGGGGSSSASNFNKNTGG